MILGRSLTNPSWILDPLEESQRTWSCSDKKLYVSPKLYWLRRQVHSRWAMPCHLLLCKIRWLQRWHLDMARGEGTWELRALLRQTWLVGEGEVWLWVVKARAGENEWESREWLPKGPVDTAEKSWKANHRVLMEGRSILRDDTGQGWEAVAKQRGWLGRTDRQRVCRALVSKEIHIWITKIFVTIVGFCGEKKSWALGGLRSPAGISTRTWGSGP